MGQYPQPDGTTSTWHQGDGPTPSAHPPPASSSCTTYKSAELYAATFVATGSTATSAPTQTGTGTIVAQTSPSAAHRSLNTEFGLLACLTVLVGTALGSLVVLA